MKWSLKALLRPGSKRARTEQSQRTPGVMVSAGLCEKATPQLLGPFFIEESCKIDSSVYCRILEDNYAPAMSLIPAPVVWQEDNAPSHNSKATRDWKKANFQYPELCWPPQSPDLAPMDYSTWQPVVSALPAERFSSKVALKAAIARGRGVQCS